MLYLAFVFPKHAKKIHHYKQCFGRRLILLKDNIILSHTVLVELERLFFLYLLFRSYDVNGKLDIILRQYYRVFFMFETQKPRNLSAGASVRFHGEKSVSTQKNLFLLQAMCMKDQVNGHQRDGDNML